MHGRAWHQWGPDQLHVYIPCPTCNHFAPSAPPWALPAMQELGLLTGVHSSVVSRVQAEATALDRAMHNGERKVVL